MYKSSQKLTNLYVILARITSATTSGVDTVVILQSALQKRQHKVLNTLAVGIETFINSVLSFK